MPRRDKTGPVGQGQMTGKGMGACGSGMGGGFGNGFGMGSGRRAGCRGGLRKCFTGDADSNGTEAEYLVGQKEWLKKRIEEIDRQLENK